MAAQMAAQMTPSTPPSLNAVSTAPAPAPAKAGKTTLPKQTVSYRWVITDADKFLWNADRVLSLRSPSFPTFYPLSNSWSLLIEKQKIRRNRQQEIVTCICLCQVMENQVHPQQTILISECKFSFLHPETHREKYSITAPTTAVHVPSQPLRKSIEQEIEYNKIKECIFKGTLTIQVTANLLRITDHKETVDHTHMVPLNILRSEMHSLYKAEVFTDAIIKCEGREFKVHRAVLGAQSPVFKTMFQIDMKEKRSNMIDISDITPAAISDLIAYLYTGTAPNVSTLAKELLNAANKYELPRLFAMCENELKMKIKVANVVDTLILADLHSAVHLKKACLDFIRQHSADVHKTSKWMYLKENLDQYAALVFEALE